MIQQKTILKVADNSGVKKVKCLSVLGGLNKKTGKLGEIIVVSILNFRQVVKKKNDITKLKKGDVFLAIIIRLKKKIKKKDGLSLFFYENSVCLLNKQKKKFNSYADTWSNVSRTKTIKTDAIIYYHNCRILLKKTILTYFLNKKLFFLIMSFLSSYNSNILTYDLINKFHFVSTKTITKTPQIIIQIFLKDKSIKQLLKCILALHLITLNKLKIKITVKKGTIHNCKILIKKKIYRFIFIQISLENLSVTCF